MFFGFGYRSWINEYDHARPTDPSYIEKELQKIDPDVHIFWSMTENRFAIYRRCSRGTTSDADLFVHMWDVETDDREYRAPARVDVARLIAESFERRYPDAGDGESINKKKREDQARGEVEHKAGFDRELDSFADEAVSEWDKGQSKRLVQDGHEYKVRPKPGSKVISGPEVSDRRF